jgi:hypothetical protein
MSSKIKLKFGVVEHGWFPITLVTSDGEFIIDASDIPIDPILEIIKAVEGACVYNSRSEAWFSLEPYYYQMVFEPINENIKISVFYVDEHGIPIKHNSRLQRKTKEFEYVGNANEVLIQFWRGLKELSSREKGYLREIKAIEDAAKKI